MNAYSKVQSFELRAFDRKTQSSPRTEQVTVPIDLIAEIKKDIQTPENDQFPIATLQIPEDLTTLALDFHQRNDDENSEEPSE